MWSWLDFSIGLYVGGAFALLIDAHYSGQFYGKETWKEGLLWPWFLLLVVIDGLLEWKAKRAEKS